MHRAAKSSASTGFSRHAFPSPGQLFFIPHLPVLPRDSHRVRLRFSALPTVCWRVKPPCCRHLARPMWSLSYPRYMNRWVSRLKAHSELSVSPDPQPGYSASKSCCRIGGRFFWKSTREFFCGRECARTVFRTKRKKNSAGAFADAIYFSAVARWERIWHVRFWKSSSLRNEAGTSGLH